MYSKTWRGNATGTFAYEVIKAPNKVLVTKTKLYLSSIDCNNQPLTKSVFGYFTYVHTI